MAFNFLNRMSWLTISKSFRKFIRIMPLSKPLWKPFRILLFKKGQAKVGGVIFAKTRLINV